MSSTNDGNQVRLRFAFTEKWAISSKKTISSRTVMIVNHSVVVCSASLISPIDSMTEPGYYQENDFGIRLETVLRVVRKSFKVMDCLIH